MHRGIFRVGLELYFLDHVTAILQALELGARNKWRVLAGVW